MTLKLIAAKYIDELNSIYDKNEIEAMFLLALHHFLKLSRADYLIKKDHIVDEQNTANFMEVLQALKIGKPIQYILGETYFYGLPFKVDETVLIPRPETEELVDWIISMIKPLNTTLNILDIGTGSGCIAIALRKNLPNTQVYALDVAEDTLATAQENAQLNKCAVHFIHQDILKYQHQKHQQQYQIIVSNPPYIKEDEKPAMHQNVLSNEPHRALFVSNENPLLFYEAICNFALLNLEKGGSLFFEINEYLGLQTVELLQLKGFINIVLRKDMQGKDRMIKANL